jgi:hypothetical protein
VKFFWSLPHRIRGITSSDGNGVVLAKAAHGRFCLGFDTQNTRNWLSLADVSNHPRLSHLVIKLWKPLCDFDRRYLCRNRSRTDSLSVAQGFTIRGFSRDSRTPTNIVVYNVDVHKNGRSNERYHGLRPVYLSLGRCCYRGVGPQQRCIVSAIGLFCKLLRINCHGPRRGRSERLAE